MVQNIDYLNELQSNWKKLSQNDKLSVISGPTKKGNELGRDDFLGGGIIEVNELMRCLEDLHIAVPSRKILTLIR